MKEMKHRETGEGGFTLVEILASVVLLAIVGLSMTAYFINALSYAKGNQNKTVMINLARNTLFYIQKQSNFDQMKVYFKSGQVLGVGEKRDSINSDGCLKESSSCYTNLVTSPQALVYILNPVINGVSYQVNISYQEELYNKLVAREQDSSINSDGKDTETTGRIGTYLLPIKVQVSEVIIEGDGKKTNLNKREKSEVEGYITDETIR